MVRSAVRSSRRAVAPTSWTPSRAVLAAAVLGTALAYMSDDMLNLAVPSLARDLGASLAGVQWVLDSYYVTLVAFVLVAGSVGDIMGHRRVFEAGLVAFSAGALLCAAAPSVPVLVVGRALQGIAAAMVLTAGLALVTSADPPATRDREVARFFGLVAAVPALGPFLSGVLVDLLSWRWLFLVPLVLPLAALWITTRRVHPTVPRRDRRPDVPGSLAVLVTLCGLSVALIAGRDASNRILALLASGVSVVAAACFVVIERRSRDPLLPLRFFRRRRFLGGNLVWLLGCMTSWGATFFLAVSLQSTLGLRPMAAGIVLTPIYVVMMLGSPLAGRVAARWGAAWPVLGGLLVYIGGLLLLAGIGAETSLAYILTSVGVLALGMAALTAPLAAVTLGSLEESEQGLASGVNNAMGQLAGLLAISVLPALAGLRAESVLSGPEFAAAYPSALRAAAGLAAGALVIAVITFRPARGRGAQPTRSSPAGAALRSSAPSDKEPA